MAQEFSKPFYNSVAWIKCRESYIAYRRSVDGGMCEICHDALGEDVHHKEKLTKENISDPNVALNFDNLEYLCKSCHFNKHHRKKEAIPNLCGVLFTQVGEPVQIPPENRG